MSTLFDLRNLQMPRLTRTSVILGIVAVVVALVAGIVGWQLYRKLTTNTVIAYFTEANGIYPGDRVEIMGVPVGAIDKIEPAGDQMKVTFHYANKYKVPKDARAVIVNPTLVASRNIQLEPPYTGGPALQDSAVIPVQRTQVPVEWDQLRNDLTRIIKDLGPTKEQPKGPFGDVIESFADGLAGKGDQINTTLNSLATSLTALGEGRGDFFAVVRSLALFVNALHENDRQFVALNKDLAQLTGNLTNSDQELADAIQQVDKLLPTLRTFLDQNGPVLTHDINNLSEVTTALVQPDALDGIETVLHVLPALQSNLNGIYHPANGGVTQIPALNMFANPLSFICSAIQAGSRLGYQESAELCAQYLAPIMDAIKFNYLPFGLNPFQPAAVLPKQVSYSEERLRPPPGYKDTTVPGIFAKDTPTSHGNHNSEGWIVAPGMQNTQVGGFTAAMLTPESLAELLGGPNIVPPPDGQTPPGAPNDYDEQNPLPPPWYPQPGPPPAPGPGVVPGPPPPNLVIPGTGPAQSPLAAEAPAPPGAGQ
ncbi:virulence factor Mce family protein [Mycobacterium talmoniae]|uniref:Mammalian cell entry protein n=1 Tax=Mycobacterium talmoniae TaxID=1858794 RepID=A0A1S1NQ60_9MYCO|nr:MULTISPECIES: virulence factor Mce family protein [Mycobacterium]OHV06734.1 mammalian cell entry protein [Mycobacterium talmoniae]TDH56460.1 virulence factor Mce family protein [Mycobacterium eburneum]